MTEQFLPVEPLTPSDILQDEAPEEFIDTYAFGGVQRYEFNGGKQWFEFKLLTEGDRVSYERMTNKDLTFNRGTGDARIKVDQGGDRAALIKIAVTNFCLYTKDKATGSWIKLSYTSQELDTWLKLANPKLVEDLDDAIRKANPWLREGDQKPEDIRKAIEELQGQLVEAERREAGKER